MNEILIGLATIVIVALINGVLTKYNWNIFEAAWSLLVISGLVYIGAMVCYGVGTLVLLVFR